MAITGSYKTQFGETFKATYFRVSSVSWDKQTGNATYTVSAYSSADTAKDGVSIPLRTWTYTFKPEPAGNPTVLICYGDLKPRIVNASAVAAPKISNTGPMGAMVLDFNGGPIVVDDGTLADV